jgi:LemA protein
MDKIKSNLKLVAIIAAGVFAVILLCVFAVQGTQNKAYSLEEQVLSAQSDISVQEKRRAELLPNLVDCVKEYDEHEYNTLMGVIEARGAGSDAAAEEVQTMISALTEAYPELKSNENYKQLMNEMTITENLIANYRENYNKQIEAYNRYVRKFPTRMFLDWLGYEAQTYDRLNYGNTYSEAPTDLFED